MSDYRSRQRITTPDIYAGGKNMNDQTTQPIEATVTLSEIEAACVAYREHQQRVGGSASFEGCMAAALGSLLHNRACQPAAEASDNKPFFYAVADNEGKAVVDEICCSEGPAELEDYFHDQIERLEVKIVPVYTGAQIEKMKEAMAALRAEVERLRKEREIPGTMEQMRNHYAAVADALRTELAAANKSCVYWLREALSRDTDGDEKDVEIRRLVARIAALEAGREVELPMSHPWKRVPRDAEMIYDAAEVLAALAAAGVKVRQG